MENKTYKNMTAIDFFKQVKRTKRCGTIRFGKLIFDVEQIEAIYLSEQVVDE